MIRTESLRGRIALMAAHCAGMVDLVSLPIWVGTLMGRYQLSAQQAGSLVTLFLTGAVLASLALAPLFNRLPGRAVAALGFALSALCFWALSTTTDWPAMAILHGLAGMATGASLSITHGTIARSANPHRLFAIVGIALGVFAIAVLGLTTQLVARWGGPVLFLVFCGVMAVATLVTLIAFPAPDAASAESSAADPRKLRIPDAVWFGIVGIACMGLVQSMTFSFLERVGNDRGFGLQAVTGVLIGLGFVNLFPAGLAAMMQHRWSARTVLLVGPLLQALLVNTMMGTTAFAPYAAAASVFAAVMIFTHTFAFGLLARMDSSGRAMAATPAMLMVGAAIGPILGGTLVGSFGYGSLGVGAALIAAVAMFCFSRLPTTTTTTTSTPTADAAAQQQDSP